MRSDTIAISVENISKCYRIGLKENLQDTFAKSIFHFIKSPLNNYRRYRSLYRFDDIDPHSNSHSSDIIWALRDISFQVVKGEVLGIIGRNGAGKSTILKILSRITDPTRGRIEIHGKNASLLEVGTGFHMELTGRENVYLNGTVLGMAKKEVDRKFDAIVDFSGVEKFIDTPVKRYSSGMKVRLAFSVAAHLEPEILIVDEVLAVGDAEFQTKCVGKMSNVAKEGRTVLFVSHNMGAITELCSRVLWLDEGRLKKDGSPMDVVTEYLSSGLASGAHGTGVWIGKTEGEASGRLAWVRHARVFSEKSDEFSPVFRYDERIKVEIQYQIQRRVKAFRSYIILRDSFGNLLWGSHDTDGTGKVGQSREAGIYNSTCVFPDRLLRPGRYFVSIGIHGQPREAIGEEHLDVMSFEISVVDYVFNRDQRIGLLTPSLSWDVARQEERRNIVV